MLRGFEVQEAFDAVLNAEGSYERSFGSHAEPQRNQHGRDKTRRLILRFLDECPDELTVVELREALDE